MQEEIRGLEIRFEENTPFEMVEPSQPISHYYQREGIHRIVFQVRLKDGRSLQSQTNIQISIPKELKSEDETSKDTYRVISIPAKYGVHKGGTLQICYADPTAQKLRKPLIIAEGFEVSNLGFHKNVSVNTFFDNVLSCTSSYFTGFDVVYLGGELQLPDG